MIEEIERLVIEPGATVRRAMEAIDDGTCGIALMVDRGRRLQGTITDGDIRRVLLRGASLEDDAGCCVQRTYTWVGPEVGRLEVLELMQARSLKQIPIVDDEGRLVGLHMMRQIVGSEERSNWAVVMAGGKGTRLRPITESIPKPMVEVAGRPILERIVLHLVGRGIRRIFLAVNYKRQVIEDHFGDGADYGCRIDYLREERPLGTGGALSLLPAEPASPLVVLNGDVLTQTDLPAMLEAHKQAGCPMTVAVSTHTHVVPYGVLRLESGRVAAVEEKPEVSWSVNAGIYVVDPALLGRIPAGVEYSMPQLVEDCLGRGEAVGAYSIDGYWFDIGRPGELRSARGEGER